MADRDPDTLSGGQQQRVALARALAPGPDLLSSTSRCRRWTPDSGTASAAGKRDPVGPGRDDVYVTHDQAEALAVSDRVAVMRDGTPEQVAPPRTIYREPATAFVATFVGDNNVLSGTVTAVRSTVRAEDADNSDDESGYSIADVTVDDTTLSWP